MKARKIILRSDKFVAIRELQVDEIVKKGDIYFTQKGLTRFDKGNYKKWLAPEDVTQKKYCISVGKMIVSPCHLAAYRPC